MDTMQLARPTAAQRAWHEMELEMFVHFGPSTWQDQDGDDLSTPLSALNPAQLDTEQWCDVAESFGARQIILVAKHIGGFCQWQTETSAYGVKETPWRGGKGDLVGELSESCSRRGLRLGIYLSPMDRFHKAGLGGRCSTAEGQERYIKVYRQQLTELLSRYGPIAEVWFDGSLIFDVSDVVNRYAPEAIQFQGPHASIRWPGNEDGVVRYPAWNTLSSRDARTGIATNAHGDQDGEAWLPLESDTTIRGRGWGKRPDPQAICWFWNTYNLAGLKSLEWLVESYYRSVGHGSVLLLNANPDTTGRIPEPDAKRVAEFGAAIRARFGASVAETCGRGENVELALPAGQRVDHVILQEDISFGHRVRKYVLEGQGETGPWTPLTEGTAIGNKKIDFFAGQELRRIRFRAIESVGPALLRRMAAFHVGNVPKFDRHVGHEHDVYRAGDYGANVTAEGTTVDLDVSTSCGAARQYELEVRPEAGSAAISVERVEFAHDGLTSAEFIAPGGKPLTYILTVTALGGEKHVRLGLKRCGEGAAKGLFFVRGM